MAGERHGQGMLCVNRPIKGRLCSSVTARLCSKLGTVGLLCLSFGVHVEEDGVPILICATAGDIHFTSKLLVISNFVSAFWEGF